MWKKNCCFSGIYLYCKDKEHLLIEQTILTADQSNVSIVHTRLWKPHVCTACLASLWVNCTTSWKQTQWIMEISKVDFISLTLPAVFLLLCSFAFIILTINTAHYHGKTPKLALLFISSCHKSNWSLINSRKGKVCFVWVWSASTSSPWWTSSPRRTLTCAARLNTRWHLLQRRRRNQY